MIGLDNLSKMAILSFKNGLRLHFDSFILFENKSFPSSVLLSVLSMEEFGKYFSLSSYVFYSEINESRDEEFEKEYLSRLYKHPFKQSMIFGRDGFKTSSENFRKASQRYYEDLKQQSVYVGYRRNKGEFLYKEGINNPDSINSTKAKEQLVFLNDLIINFVKEQLDGLIELDEPEVNDLLNLNLFNRLRNLKYTIES